MTTSHQAVIIRPLRPRNLSSWEVWPAPRAFHNKLHPHAIERWFHKAMRFSVLSAVEAVEDPEKAKEQRPEYHISICRLDQSLHPARVDSATALDVLRMFEAEGFLEDNHVPHGKVRNFWRPVAGDYVGQRCQCEGEEPTIREDRGDFVWRG